MLKFSCEKALLQLAVNTASRTVATKSSIPALEGLLLEGDDVLTLSGYNMQTGIRTRLEADIREGGRIVLSARLFGDIIRKMPDDVIVFSADEKFMVTLTCGDARFEILGLSADDYPEMPEVDDEYTFTIQQGILKAMINQTSFAVSTNENRPIHTGTLFEVGIDGGVRGRIPAGAAAGEDREAGGRRLPLRVPRQRPERGGKDLRGQRRAYHRDPRQAAPHV